MKSKITIVILLSILLMVTGALVYTNVFDKKQAVARTMPISTVIDSVRTAVIDSMQQVFLNRRSNDSPSKSNRSFGYIELYDLINLFMPDQELDYNLYDWKTEANNKSINWITSGVNMGEHEFYRKGEAVISVNGKVMECLNKNTYPCKWGIVLIGVHNGYTSFEISSVQSQELEKIEITELFKGKKFEHKLLKTDEFDDKTYRVKFPSKKPVDMTVQWSCGSGGCSLLITCSSGYA